MIQFGRDFSSVTSASAKLSFFALWLDRISNAAKVDSADSMLLPLYQIWRDQFSVTVPDFTAWMKELASDFIAAVEFMQEHCKDVTIPTRTNFGNPALAGLNISHAVDFVNGIYDTPKELRREWKKVRKDCSRDIMLAEIPEAPKAVDTKVA